MKGGNLKPLALKNFKKYFRIPAEPEIVYLALTKQHTIRLWTGANAEMNDEPGTRFSLWDGSITGTNVAFEEGKKIVQHWDFGEQETPSEVTIKLHEDKNGSTSLEVIQTNIPDEDFENILNGWADIYISSLIDFYEN